MKKIGLMCGTSMFLLAGMFFLAGCGQKGPLYLPQPAKPSPDAPKTAPTPAKPESQPTQKQGSTGH